MNPSIDAAAYKWLSANVTELTVAVARAAAVLAGGSQSAAGEREDDARPV
jgi:hypothetical protein